MENKNIEPIEEISRGIHWLSTAGIVLSIISFLISEHSNSLTTQFLSEYIVSIEYASKNDNLAVIKPLIDGNLLSMNRPDLLRQAYEAALRVNEPTISKHVADSEAAKINTFDDYFAGVEKMNGDPLKKGGELQEETIREIYNFNNWQDLVMILLVVSQIVSARLAFKAFEVTRK